MSQSYNGRDMDRPMQSAGSVRRARERAQAGLPREPPQPVRRPQMMDDGEEVELTATPLRPRPPQPNAASKVRRPRGPPQDSKPGQTISRPTQVPQWPLPGPIQSPTSPPDARSYRPPPGRPQQAPQRPPRPSQVPSLVNESRMQESTPVFLTPQSIPENAHDPSPEYLSTTLVDAPSASSRLTTSSVGSIPDFPAPVAAGPAIPARRSFNLGPPPSSRRGASSFYSNASWVSPIPEESPRSRSHLSYASSAAMPEAVPDAWRPGSPMASPGADVFYEESVTDKSRDSAYDDFGDESKLVRSASLGKKGKAALIETRGAPSNNPPAPRPSPSPIQSFDNGTAYFDVSTSSSNTLPTAKPTPVTTPGAGLNPNLGQDGILGLAAVAAAARTPSPGGSPDPGASSRPYTRLSAIRRPPKLDIDAVRTAEARGSLTSLPDLIRRATRLAAMIDGGKRPASRFEDFSEFLGEKSGGRDGTKEMSDDRHQSGLSDMLAAFPPPAQNERQSRGSWFRTTSWPLAPGQEGSPRARGTRSSPDGAPKKPRRRCCGLPLWAFVLVVLLLLCIVAAAIVVPLEFFVFKNLGNHRKADSALEQCEKTLSCLNGGTSVISQGSCSCICTNGFTGSDCSKGGNAACTTTNLVSSDGSSTINNVTLGGAIPRLIADAQGNFSIPLSGTAILAKFSSTDLSCIAQNSLVTFEGRSTRAGVTSAEVQDITDTVAKEEWDDNAAFVSVSIITFNPDTHTTLTINDGEYAVEAPTTTSETPSSTEVLVVDTSAAPETTSSPSDKTSATTTATAAEATATFDVTEEVLDFARVAVLYVLQEGGFDEAETAQTDLQAFFTKASATGVSGDAADSVNIGGNNIINLVALTVDLGEGAVGSSAAKRAISYDLIDTEASRRIARRGGSLIPRR